MRKKRSFFIIVSALTIVILFIGLQQWKGLNPKAEALSEQEAKALVERRYKGEVSTIKQKDEQFLIEMVRNDIRYEIKLGVVGGEVLAFSKMGNTTKNSEQKPDPSILYEKSEEEIKSQLSSKFAGEVISFNKQQENGRSIFEAIFKDKDKKTIVKVDAHTGEILFRKTIEFNEPAVRITEDEAAQIALEKVKGVIDDIDLETDDNLSYYLVEIKTGDEREATIQIHAITGEVLSVTWDD